MESDVDLNWLVQSLDKGTCADVGGKIEVWMKMFDESAEELSNEQDRLKLFASRLIPYARQGIPKLTMRFGQQPQLEELYGKLTDYAPETDMRFF